MLQTEGKKRTIYESKRGLRAKRDAFLVLTERLCKSWRSWSGPAQWLGSLFHRWAEQKDEPPTPPAPQQTWKDHLFLPVRVKLQLFPAFFNHLLGDPVLYDGGVVELEQAFSGQAVNQAYNGLLAALGAKSALLLLIIDHLLQPAEREILLPTLSTQERVIKCLWVTLSTDWKRPSMTLKLRTASTIRFFLLNKRYVWWDLSKYFSSLVAWRRWNEMLVFGTNLLTLNPEKKKTNITLL